MDVQIMPETHNLRIRHRPTSNCQYEDCIDVKVVLSTSWISEVSSSALRSDEDTFQGKLICCDK